MQQALSGFHLFLILDTILLFHDNAQNLKLGTFSRNVYFLIMISFQLFSKNMFLAWQKNDVNKEIVSF